ncbi:MAG: hypothetical protein K2Q22_02655, partial [Cytophagales bacterium]|nr:hypothetical protein [Cytophagales bacterium]
DDYPLSTSEIIQLLSRKMGKKAIMIQVPKFCWNFLATLGDWLGGPFDTEVLGKITDSMVVDNSKIKLALDITMPEETRTAIVNIV